MLSILARQSKPESRAYSGERLVNYFLRPSDGATQAVLLARGGLVPFVDLGTETAVRAMEKMGGNLYAVSGGKVWKIVAGVASDVGAVPDGETFMAANRTQVAIVVSGRYFVCDGTATVEVTPGAIETAVSVVSADGYIIVLGLGAGLQDLVQTSALDDAETFDALNFAAAEYMPDALVGAIYDHGQLYLFGTETTEVFYNAGADAFPFLPNRSAQVEHGCISGKTIAKADSAVFWVRPDGAVLRNFGGTPQVISSPEVKDALAGSTVTGGFTFSHRGHEFYAVTRQSGSTFVFDITTQLWSEWCDGLAYAGWLATSRVTLSGTGYFGCSNGKIATMSEATYTDFGAVMGSEFETPLVVNKAELYRVARLHIDVDSSTGGLDRQPQAMIQASRDGFVWGDEIWRPVADVGVYGQRVTWHALGQFRRGKVRFRMTDPVKRDVIGGAVRYG